MAPSCITSSNQVGSATTSATCSATSAPLVTATEELASVAFASVAFVSAACARKIGKVIIWASSN